MINMGKIVKSGSVAGAIVGVLLSVGVGHAAPNPWLPRAHVLQRGDFIIVGNTLVQDCSSNTAQPFKGTVGSGCADSDASPDVYWRSTDVNTGAEARTSYTADQARTVAKLNLPTGAEVTHAWLYWAAEEPSTSTASGAVDDTATIAAVMFNLTDPIEEKDVTAIQSWPLFYQAQSSNFYQSVADVTEFVQEHGAGLYRVSGVDSWGILNDSRPTKFAAWAMVVFYRRDADGPRDIALFDTFDGVVTPSTSQVCVSAHVQGFGVPDNALLRKGAVGVLAYAGSKVLGDSLYFSRTASRLDSDKLVNFANTENNFFCQSRTYFGTEVSKASTGLYYNDGDLPQMYGTSSSMSGLDIHVVDVSSRIQALDTEAYIAACTTNDTFFLGAFATSIASFVPNFSTSTKSVMDAEGNLLLSGQSVLPDSILTYSIKIENTGTDNAEDVQFRDELPPGVQYVAGSLKIVDGPNVGTKTEAKDTDEAEHVAGVVTARLGLGASGATVSPPMGGKLAINEFTILQFDVKIDNDFVGQIENVAQITAKGEMGVPVLPTAIMGDSLNPASATVVLVHGCDASRPCDGDQMCVQDDASGVKRCVECATYEDCGTVTAPVCFRNECFPCASSIVGGCQNPALPVCLETGECVECSDTDRSRCTGNTPACDVDEGACKGCSSDEQCAFDAAGPSRTPACASTGACEICSGTNVTACEPGQVCDADGTWECRGCLADSECFDATPWTPACKMQATAAVGMCVQCTDTNDSACSGTTPVCNVPDSVCRACEDDAECSGDTPICAGTGACVECTDTDADRCIGEKHVCLWPEGRCVACLVDEESGVCKRCYVDDPDCGNSTSGFVCFEGDTSSQTEGYCVEGCRGKDGNRCPIDPVELHCTSADESIGQCLECVSDAHCSVPAPACAAWSVCVECSATNKTQCGEDKPACKVQDGVCGPCENDDECSGSLVCQSGMCVGCVADSDCGDPASGRVCDRESCVDGCRGEDGNGCPSGKLCTSANENIGECVDCATDSDCGAEASGRVCSNRACADGCRGESGNGCPSGKECTSKTEVIGACEDRAEDTGTRRRVIEGGGLSCAVPVSLGASSAGFRMMTVMFALGLLVLRRSRRV